MRIGSRSRPLAAATFLAAATTALVGCRRQPAEATHELSETRRSYRVVRAATHDSKRPSTVLFSLHAFWTDPRRLEESLGLRELAAESDLLLVVPQGTRDSQGRFFWNASRACCDSERRGVGDVGYLQAVLRDVKRRYSVDPARVYAVGLSNGGFMAYRWACEPGGDLRGVVAVAGAGLEPSDGPCSPSVPVAVLHVHGDQDEVVSYSGGSMNGARHPGARASVSPWITANGCAQGTQPERSRHSGLFEQPTIRETWKCPNARVALWTVPGGDHRVRLGVGFGKTAVAFLEGR